MAKRIGVLTGGGDCPGLNAAIRAVVRRGIDQHNMSVYGFRNGWDGVLQAQAEQLTHTDTRGILYRGGTVLGTSRTNPVADPADPERVAQALDVLGLDGLIVIGGEGTLSGTRDLWEHHQLPVIGIPKTIDNDLDGTDFTIGFATALDTATGAVDRLHSTAESHNRIMVLEVMGRNAGWIATYAGMAGGADAILIPERPFNLDDVVRHLKRRHGVGRTFSIVVVAEGAQPAEGTLQLPDYAKDEFGRNRLGGIGAFLGPLIEERTGFETRVTILGHVQRGGAPNAFDRVLATSMGVAAVDLAEEHRWGHMVGMRGNAIVPVSLADATRELKTVPRRMYEVAEVFFG